MYFSIGWLCLFATIVSRLIRPQEILSQLLFLLSTFVSFTIVMLEGERQLHSMEEKTSD